MPQYKEDIARSYDYDSSIEAPYFSEDRVNFEFTIMLRLYLEAVNPPNGKSTYLASSVDNTSALTIRWNRAAWLHFTEQFVKRVLEVWDKAFILVPPPGYKGFVWPEGGERRNLVCRLRIKLADSPEHVHAAVRVVRLANTLNGFFRSDSVDYDSADINLQPSKWNPDGATFLHNTPAHEIGHLLGLTHVSQHASGCTDGGDSACYGSNLHERMNIMGGGSMLDLENAKPWLTRIYEHTPPTSTADWKAGWASNEAQLRGLQGLQIDEAHKQPYQAPKPGIIDL